MKEQVLLNRLKRAQEAYALDSLKMAPEKTEYAFGYRCGVVAGYEMAINELLAMVAEEKSDRDF